MNENEDKNITSDAEINTEQASDFSALAEVEKKTENLLPSPQETSAPLKESANQVDRQTTEKINKIHALIQCGLINPLQGQNLVKYVLKRAYDSLQSGQSPLANPTEAPQNAFDSSTALSQFNKDNPDFFTPQGREQVLTYLKSANVQLDSEGISQISELIKTVENAAIERYLQKSAYEENLNRENEVAKQKLTAIAQNSTGSDKKNRVFTREQIGKMSGADFTKNESLIMDQLRKGLIK